MAMKHNFWSQRASPVAKVQQQRALAPWQLMPVHGAAAAASAFGPLTAARATRAAGRPDSPAGARANARDTVPWEEAAKLRAGAGKAAGAWHGGALVHGRGRGRAGAWASHVAAAAAGAGPRAATAGGVWPAPGHDPAPQREAAAGGPSLSFYATCHPGLEQAVAQELSALGAEGVVPGKAGVAFRGASLADGYRANMWLRGAIRVLVLLSEGQLDTDLEAGRRGGEALYEFVLECAPWHDLIPPGATFSVEPRLRSCTDINSTQLVWSRVKDAVCDAVRRHRPEKPMPPDRGAIANVPLYVTLYQDRVKVYRDMSGESLHRRGYRDVMHKAALNEAAAAGILILAGWPEVCRQQGADAVLADPMCGSATFLIEAALMARRIAPGLPRSLDLAASPRTGTGTGTGTGSRGGGRRSEAPLAAAAWPFQAWPDHSPREWAHVVDEARDSIVGWKGRLLGNDIHPGALSLAERQVARAGVQDLVQLQRGDCGAWRPSARPSLVVANPPWGDRLFAVAGGSDERYDRGADSERHGARGAEVGGAASTSGDGSMSLEGAWRSLDGFMYRECPGAMAYIVSGSREVYRHIKLKPSVKHALVLSGVEVRVAGYLIRPRDGTPVAAPVVAAAAAAAPQGPDGDAEPAAAAAPAAQPRSAARHAAGSLASKAPAKAVAAAEPAAVQVEPTAGDAAGPLEQQQQQRTVRQPRPPPVVEEDPYWG